MPHFCLPLKFKWAILATYFKVTFKQTGLLNWCWCNGFTRESSYCFQRILAISILSVCLPHGWISQKRCKLKSPNLHRRLPGRL